MSVEEIMDEFGVTREFAEFVYAVGTGQIPGDVFEFTSEAEYQAYLRSIGETP
jgi:hypothetical protein